MSDRKSVNRRNFLGASLGLVGAGGVAGWAVHRRGIAAKPERPPLGGSFTYDVSAFEKTDPALLRYDETGRIPTGFTAPRCIEMARGNLLFAAGDAVVKVFDGAGAEKRTFALSEKAQALAHAADDRLVVAYKDRLELRDAAGAVVAMGEPLPGKTHFTSVTVAGETIFAADAGVREVVKLDMSCKVIGRFGRKGANDGNPGFAIPSAYFDIELGPDGLLWVTNTGRHQIEAYTLDGTFELGWGATGMAIENFCGCCNPVHFTRLPDGRFVTSEKGLNRIKIYDARGAFSGVVAGADHLVKDLELARRACADCRIGFGFDVACDDTGRVYALDPATRDIRIFTPKKSGGAV